MNNPSQVLSGYVRATIICRNLPVTNETASAELIDEIAGNLTSNGHKGITGYDVAEVRAILLNRS
jgi:hypothetical protein